MEVLPVNTDNIKIRKETSRLKQTVINWLITIGGMAICVIISELLQSTFDVGDNMIMLYILTVLVISSLTPGYFMGFVSAVLATLIYNYLVIDPKFVFNFSYKLLFTVLTMLIVTVASSFIAATLKQQTKDAVERKEKISLLYDVHQELSKARSIKEVAAISNRMMIQQINRSVVLYFREPSRDGVSYCSFVENDLMLEDFTSKDELRFARNAFDENEATPLTGPYAKQHKVYYVPVHMKERVLGIVGISLYKGSLSESEMRFVKLLISQLGPALELIVLEDKQRRAQLETEKEKMRNRLLRSVSHDLRTPLTSVLGAATTLHEEYDQLDRRTHKELTENIISETQWLIRMVENLLTVTKILGDSLEIKKQSEAAEEVLAQAVSIVRSRFPERSIFVKVPDELLTVPMDATLISQVIINFTENAIKNSDDDSLVFVNLKKDDDYALFEVSDEGRGIAPNVEDSLFERQIESTDATHGLGIGLSICNTIVQAHNGTNKREKKKEGGAIFSFWLPLESDESANQTAGTDN